LSLPQEELPPKQLPGQELDREAFPREAIANEQWAFTALAEQTGAAVPSPNRALWFEVAVVLLICVIPDLFSALRYSGTPATLSRTLLYEQPWLIVRSAGAIALIFFIVSKSGQSRVYFGIRRLRWMDLLMGLAVFLAGIVGYYVSMLIVYSAAIVAGIHPPVAASHHAAGAVSGALAQLPIIIVASLANGWAEELVCRAYLITRFKQLLGSPVAALFLSAFLFSSYHIYQGIWSACGIFGVGMAYGAIFIWTRRIWPLALGHALQDIMSLMILAMHR